MMANAVMLDPAFRGLQNLTCQDSAVLPRRRSVRVCRVVTSYRNVESLLGYFVCFTAFTPATVGSVT